MTLAKVPEQKSKHKIRDELVLSQAIYDFLFYFLPSSESKQISKLEDLQMGNMYEEDSRKPTFSQFI